MTLQITLASDVALRVTPNTSGVRVSPVPGDSRQLTAEMSARLCDEFEGRVPPGLVAEIVRSVLDESRHCAQQRADEFTMVEARHRLERFIRARASQ